MKFEYGSRARAIGHALSVFIGLFFLLDGAMKVYQPAVVMEATFRLGYPNETVAGIGLLLMGCTLVYLVPRTSILGAILLTGYLGGAIASHVRVAEERFPIVFAFGFGLIVWLGLYLRDPRVRALFCAKYYGHGGA